MVSLTSVLVLLAIFGPFSSAASTYYVTPNISLCSKDPCYEFGTYFHNASYYFQSETEFIFLPGVHVFDLGELLSIENIVDLSLVGSDNFTQHTVAENVREYGFDPYKEDSNITYQQSSTVILCSNHSGISFSNVTNLTLSDLTLLNCGQHSPMTSQTAGVHITNVHNLLINGVSIQNSSGYGLLGVNVLGKSYIKGSSFVGNNQFVKDSLQRTSIDNCRNERGSLYTNNGSLAISNYTGGNIFLEYTGASIRPIQLTILSTIVALGMDASMSRENNDPASPGTGLSLSMKGIVYFANVYVNNLVAYRNQGYQGANLFISVFSSGWSVTIANMHSSYATSMLSGVFYYFSQLIMALGSLRVVNSSFECNNATSSYVGSSLYLHVFIGDELNFSLTIDSCQFRWDGGISSFLIQNSGTVVTPANIVVTNCSFAEMLYWTNALTCYGNHNYLYLTNSFILSSTVLITGCNVIITNSTFIQCPWIAQQSTISIAGTNTFRDVFASTSGSALNLAGSKVNFMAFSEVVFINNTATKGGALYIDSYSSISFSSPTNVSFINNTAFFTGGAIYVEAPSSTACFYMYSLNCTDIQQVENISLNFEGNYAGDAGSVLYGGNIDTCQMEPSCLNNSTATFINISRIGYHDNSTSLISSDSPCVYSCSPLTCLSNLNISIYPGQTIDLKLVAVGQSNGIVPTVILVYSNAANRAIGAIRTLKQCALKTIPYELMNGTQSLITEVAVNSGQLFTDTTFSIHLTVLPCPLMFSEDSSSSSCVCDLLLRRHNLICNISNVTVQNEGNIWIGLTAQGVPAFQDVCPFDYCTQNKFINVSDLDSQCNYGRTGVLCGHCHGNQSMTFGSSQCANCSNYYLLLIIVFIVMGAALVAVLLILNFTVSNGALNGIVLYVNFIRINDTLLFQSKSGYSYVLSIIIAWINLDFGIETCFYDGMDSYVKTWLQFVFPLYVFSLVGAIIFVGQYSSSVSKLNAVPVLSTLVLLSYSKILRTTITIFSFVSLDLSNNSAGLLVWQYDGNIDYLGAKHLPLFLFGLLVTTVFVIPYSILFFLAPCSQARSHWSCLHWVNKLKPFLDSYQAPFKDRYRIWPGVLLFVRLPLYVIFIISSNTSVKMLTTIVFLQLYLCIAVGLSVYKSWSVLLTETFFIANISVVSATVVALSNTKSGEAIILIAISAAVFLSMVVIIYERSKKKASSLAQMCLKGPINHNETQSLVNKSGSSGSGSSASGSSGSGGPFFPRSVEFREPLMDNTSLD
eukprot:Em0022g81a